jgi:hypothetical protein
VTYVALDKTACRDFHQSTAVITTTSFIIFLIKFKTLLLMKAYPLISTAPISALRFILPAKTGKVRQRYNCIRKANDRNCTCVGT